MCVGESSIRGDASEIQERSVIRQVSYESNFSLIPLIVVLYVQFIEKFHWFIILNQLIPEFDQVFKTDDWL